MSAVSITIGAESTVVSGPNSSFTVPMGGESVVAAHIHRDPPGPEELSAALSVIELHLDDLRRQQPELVAAIARGPVVGTGVLAEIAAVEIGVDVDGHPDTVDGYHLTAAQIEEVFRALATETSADRAFNPGLRPWLVDPIVGHLCVLVEFIRQFAVPEILISVSDVEIGSSVPRTGRPVPGPDQ